MSPVRRSIAVIVGLAVYVIGVLLGVPPTVIAQEYDLSFTLPTAGKSGCMVCHADKNLVRIQGDRVYSYYVDPQAFAAGPHATIMCTGCHLDFAYKAPHDTADGQWRRTARLACKNCHLEQWNAYSAGVHSLAVQPGESTTTAAAENKPLCGDCHGSHQIAKLTDNPKGKAELHRRGYEVCGRCHQQYWDSYADYYHGAAYRRGATDAPACWQCHGYHDILPSNNRRSKVHKARLAETCGACHPNVNETYISYAEFVHRKADIVAANPMAAFVNRAWEEIRSVFAMIGAWLS